MRSSYLPILSVLLSALLAVGPAACTETSTSTSSSGGASSSSSSSSTGGIASSSSSSGGTSSSSSSGGSSSSSGGVDAGADAASDAGSSGGTDGGFDGGAADAGTDAAADAGAGDAGTDAGADAGPPGPTFTADVHPLFKTYCGGCHTGSGFGGHNMGAGNVDTAYADSQTASNVCGGKTKGACAGIRVRNGEMPPGGFPDLEGRKQIADTIDAWVAAGQKK